MKRSELTVSVLLIPLDYLALLAAAAVAYTLRFSSFAEIRPITFHLPFPVFLRSAALVALCWIIIFALAGCYALAARRRWTTEFNRVFLASSSGFALVLAIIVFSRELFASRFIVLAGWVLAVIFVLALRLVIRFIERIFLRSAGARGAWC